VHTLELGKLPRKADGSQLWNWLKFLDARSEEDLRMIAERNPMVKKAVVRLMELSKDEQERMWAEAVQKKEMDDRVRESDAEDRGLEKGLQRRNLEVARNALRIGIPIADIATLTGLTCEEIEALR
jgi:predicted transposase/invertase (TIGR01784 family)